MPSLLSKDDTQSSIGESSSQVTPLTPASALPVSCPHFTCAGRDRCLHKFDRDYYTGDHTFHREQDIDPKTVFVGGLDAIGASVWDVEKLKSVYGKYGNVEDVRVICPCELRTEPSTRHSTQRFISTANKKTFFAFVTFSDDDAAQRAIAGEVSCVTALQHSIYSLNILRTVACMMVALFEFNFATDSLVVT